MCVLVSCKQQEPTRTTKKKKRKRKKPKSDKERDANEGGKKWAKRRNKKKGGKKWKISAGYLPLHTNSRRKRREQHKDDRTGERKTKERDGSRGWKGGRKRDGIMFEAIIGRLRILAGPLWLIKGARSGLLCAADLLLAPSRRTPSIPCPSLLPPPKPRWNIIFDKHEDSRRASTEN